MADKAERKMPARARIGHRTYTIDRTPQAHLEAEAKEGQRLWGRIDHNALVITLDPNAGAFKARETLLHEALHGVLYGTGGLSESDLKSEDGIIARLQTGLLAFLRDNPALVAWLQED